MSAGTMAEAMIVAGRNGFAEAVHSLIENFGIEIVPRLRRAGSLRRI